MAIENFRPSCGLFGKPDVTGLGHWHASIDFNPHAAMMGMGTMLAMSCARSIPVWLNGVKPGVHKFTVLLAENLHQPLPACR